MIRRLTLAVCLGLFTGWCLQAEAAIKPHGLFTDNAVLQQGQKVPVWGTTDKADPVKVQFEGQDLTATPKDGKWQVELAPLKAGGPFQMTITQGGDKLELKNLLVGDVWVCGGQSNMQWEVHQSAGAKEATEAAKDADQIRLFTVPRRGNGAPRPKSAAAGSSPARKT